MHVIHNRKRYLDNFAWFRLDINAKPLALQFSRWPRCDGIILAWHTGESKTSALQANMRMRLLGEQHYLNLTARNGPDGFSRLVISRPERVNGLSWSKLVNIR